MKMPTYKVAICAIVKNEGEYLEEWYLHHNRLGINHFFIYDNNSTVPIKNNFLRDRDNVSITFWKDDKHGSQNRAYKHCCETHSDYDYILFIDIDEFLMFSKKYTNINDFLEAYVAKVGKFNGLGISWRMYGKRMPYFQIRQPMESYTQYFDNEHIKSLVSPKAVIHFPDPHCPVLTGKYMNENGNSIKGPLNPHTSTDIWIKHVWTRSLSEFKEKIERGDANLRVKNRRIEDFENHNDQCKKDDI